MKTKEENLQQFFYTVFPADLFCLSTEDYASTNIESRKEYLSRKICVTTTPTLFMITHEMAHIIETPNARLFERNFGLDFPTYEIKDKTIVLARTFQTEVPFKRELRVFGIQAALLDYANSRFDLYDPYISIRTRFVGTVNKVLVGEKVEGENPEFKHSQYMCQSLLQKPKPEIYTYINKKIYQYSNQYHYTKLDPILKRKFDYIEKHR